MSQETTRRDLNRFQAIPKRDVEKAVAEWRAFQAGLRRDKIKKRLWLAVVGVLLLAWVIGLWWMVEGMHS